MGGATTEIGAGRTTDAGDRGGALRPVSVARMARRHKLSTEASSASSAASTPSCRPWPRRARGRRCSSSSAAAPPTPASPRSTCRAPRAPVALAAAPPARLGRAAATAADDVVATPRAGRLRRSTTGTAELTGHPADLAARPRRPGRPRRGGHPAASATTQIPSVLPAAPAGPWPDRTGSARRRVVGRALAGAGYVEAPTYPFVGEADLDALGLPADDAAPHALRLANPLSEEEPLLRTTLLPGLLDGAAPQHRPRPARRRRCSRSAWSSGPVPGCARAPRPPVDRRPTDEECGARRGAAARSRAGSRSPWPAPASCRLVGPGRPARLGRRGRGGPARRRRRRRRADRARRQHAPWHPGRCAALAARRRRVVGHAGELHPKAVARARLPERTCAARARRRRAQQGQRHGRARTASVPTIGSRTATSPS